MLLGCILASDFGEAVCIEDLRGVKILHYDGNPGNMDNFVLDGENFSEKPRRRWATSSRGRQGGGVRGHGA